MSQNKQYIEQHKNT